VLASLETKVTVNAFGYAARMDYHVVRLLFAFAFACSWHQLKDNDVSRIIPIQASAGHIARRG
jgi:hypothetical protein